MATADETLTPRLAQGEHSRALAKQWRGLTRAATFVAALTSPALFIYLYYHEHVALVWALLGTIAAVAAFRGLVDVLMRKAIPWPRLFGTEEIQLQEEDVIARRRVWFWRFWFRWAVRFAVFITFCWIIRMGMHGGFVGWWDTVVVVWDSVWGWLTNPQNSQYLFIIIPLFLINFLILFGPLLAMGITQMQAFEPGDAEWGVKLDDVRGQAEAKEDVRRVVNLWQSGEAFEEAGGKRERGLLFLGAPGTGKTMLSKAIATGFNCFAPHERFLTKDGPRTFAETEGTTQLVLNGNGEWAPAAIRSFGRQPLVEIELRPGVKTRSHVRKIVHATPDHRWVTSNRGLVTDLAAGDHIPFQASPATERMAEAFIRGFGYGDGTLDARGRARIRLCGEKDHRWLPLFQEYGHSFVSYPPSYGGDPLVVFNGGAMSNWKELPTGDEDPAWLASWVEGYLAADGWTTRDGEVVLETQDAAAVDFVSQVAVHAGYMVVGRTVKAASMVTNYGPRSAPLQTVKLRRGGVWQVLGVRPLPIQSEVYCAVEPKTGTFTLDGGVLTGNCPFLSMPGSGFAQTFIGMDVVIVRYLAWKAKRLARKWGGQCIVFIDEIDAVGRRRQALGGEGAGFMTPRAGVESFEEHCFYGPNGSLTPSGDLVLETRAWRERMFEQRAERPRPNAFLAKLGAIVNQVGGIGMMGGMGSGALNQLLVVMDGIDNPPFFKRFWTNRINTLLDAVYVVPPKVGSSSLRLPPPRPRGDQIYFIGATNVPIEVLDPALVRPGRMGRHVWFRTPTQKDRLDVFDLYITKVAHVEELDTPERRDELARIANGYSPAMIQQVCSMALTYAHTEGRPRFDWEDIVEAMTTVESGTAINIDYVPEETRAVAIHEAGHAVASHVYMKGAESTRISIRRRGGALGHHQALEKEERFTSWRSEEMSRLIWTLGAMAAEHVFYGENATGVGGDIFSATSRSAWMVGSCGMAPPRPQLNGSFRSKQKEKEVRLEMREQFREIGTQIMMRSGSGAMHDDQTRAVLGDPDKRRLATEFLGQAFLAAYHLILHNKEKVEAFSNVVIERKEIYGNELLQMLDEAKFEVPKVDLTKEEAWPTIA